MSTKQDKKISVLLEMRPALEGFAGIPQEVRLLFRGLCKIDAVEVTGMLQTSHKILAKGTPEKKRWFAREIKQDKKINKHSRVIISMAEKPYRTLFDKIVDFLEKKLYSTALTLETIFFGHNIKLTKFESTSFEDFIWRTMFSKTLPASDFNLVTKSSFRVNSVPWHVMHMVGLGTLSVRSLPKYPKLNTTSFDVFIGQTPYPAQTSLKTKMVIRYHDAIPVFMPHTISDKSIHQATHFYALKSNVEAGAWFACVSEATRQDLLRLFPEANDRAVVIHNMVSHHYYNEESEKKRVAEIIRSRQYSKFEDETKEYGLVPKFLTLREQENFYKRLENSDLKYLLVVSSVEPRKNHTRLLAAWEVIKSEIDPSLKLIVVGTLGWDYSLIVRSFTPWIDRGQLFMLNAVPAPDLRVLYKHAAATVCPSLGEGFDFSGVESMASGGITIASDIPVHREVYGESAEYFDPYSTASLVKGLKKVLYDKDSQTLRDEMREQGRETTKHYQPATILPQWEDFLQRITHEEK